jgi:hypothetical protein
MGWEYCDHCGKRTSSREMWDKQVCRASHSGPAEYERYCLRPSCRPEPERDDVYERAAARYDGSGRDWR